MARLNQSMIQKAIKKDVMLSLNEDVMGNDLTSSLIDKKKLANGHLKSNQSGILCGQAWFNQSFKSINNKIKIRWHINDGDAFKKKQLVCSFKGPYQDLLKAERTAINFLQTLSATATLTHKYVKTIEGYNAKIFDTRKTIPGLRIAQKYAVRTGGGNNQRLGLYDEILIKENHIASFNSFEEFLNKLKEKKLIEKAQIEVETISQLKLALTFGAKKILLDNFSIQKIKQAVQINQKKATLEASGNITIKNIRDYAKTGIDRISVGSLTKNIEAIDFSVKISQI
ncbi:MAG: carboxylating nicotinate-nucleotide diphosphorylase [Methylophilaceae bacterium]